MIFLQKLEEKLEDFFFKSGKHRVFHDKYRLGIVVDNGYFITIDHLADIVLEEIEVFGDGDDLPFQSRSFRFGEGFARNHTSLNLFLRHEFAVILGEVCSGFFEIGSRAVPIIGISLFQSVEYIVEYESNTLFPAQSFDGRFFLSSFVHLFQIRESRLEPFCEILHDGTEFLRRLRHVIEPFPSEIAGNETRFLEKRKRLVDNRSMEGGPSRDIGNGGDIVFEKIYIDATLPFRKSDFLKDFCILHRKCTEKIQ